MAAYTIPSEVMRTVNGDAVEMHIDGSRAIPDRLIAGTRYVTGQLYVVEQDAYRSKPDYMVHVATIYSGRNGRYVLSADGSLSGPFITSHEASAHAARMAEAI